MVPPVPPIRSSQSTTIPATRRSSSSGSDSCGNDPYQSSNPCYTMSSPSIAASSTIPSPTTVIKCEVMVQYLRQRQIEKLWSDGHLNEGVVLKRAKNDFVCQPPELSQQMHGFYNEIRKLNVKVRLHKTPRSQAAYREQVAMTVKTAVIQTFLREYNMPFVPLKNGLQMQVLPNIGGLSRCSMFLDVRGCLRR